MQALPQHLPLSHHRRSDRQAAKRWSLHSISACGLVPANRPIVGSKHRIITVVRCIIGRPIHQGPWCCSRRSFTKNASDQDRRRINVAVRSGRSPNPRTSSTMASAPALRSGASSWYAADSAQARKSYSSGNDISTILSPSQRPSTEIGASSAAGSRTL